MLIDNCCVLYGDTGYWHDFTLIMAMMLVWWADIFFSESAVINFKENGCTDIVVEQYKHKKIIKILSNMVYPSNNLTHHKLTTSCTAPWYYIPVLD